MNVTDLTRSTASTPTAHVSECGNQSPTHPIAVTGVHTNTWWTYLGWKENPSAVQADASAQNEAQMQSIGVHAFSAAPDQPTTFDPTESLQSAGEIKAQVDLSSDVSVTECSLFNSKNPPSVQNADSTRVPHGSAWYAPWFWYQPSSSSATPALDMNSCSQQDLPVHSQTGPNAEEKRPAGDHEVHSPPNQVSPSPQDPSATGSVDYGNPIQSVISANPTRWMSFFTAKAIAMKSITYDKEDGKMEVMEIDDETPPEPNSQPSSATAVSQPSPIQVTKPLIREQPRTSDVLPPSPPPKRIDDKPPPVPRAATNTETVVDNSLKRQPSPSPSKKSGMKTPTSPPPPNLVLPTWNDTFCTLPRSAVPREPPSALSKTLQYVSGVLFSRDETPSNKGKDKAKEPVYSPYGKALPRTWDVLGGGGVVDVLRGCRKVVIIGVHGWFPGGSPPWICNEVVLTRAARRCRLAHISWRGKCAAICRM